ncbi:MAG: hypothetical protein JRI23_29745 [Deltaproteobacteria bacterium]|jgi:uncharacterized tellurite resistance protein B-like protein|nr:hypothetical protein [Deltaproteobacteria bacterium]MBW2536334.1 hypothetical protein [Deltaproteobacteria bacterium]
MDAEFRRRVLGLIFGLTVKDGQLSDSEIAFMERTYAAFGVPTDKESWVMPVSDPEDAVAELRAMPDEARQEALGLLIEAASVDGVIHEAERSYLVAAAEAVGWTAEQLEEKIVDQLAQADVS